MHQGLQSLNLALSSNQGLEADQLAIV